MDDGHSVSEEGTFGIGGAAGPGQAANEGAEHGADHRSVSIAYLALVAMTGEPLETQAHWLSWYALFPWEDRREGEPPLVRELRDRLVVWGRGNRNAHGGGWEERVDLMFGTGRVPWDEERALERYEMLYAAGLVDEAFRDRGYPLPLTPGLTFGVSLAADHRRIAATAISRLRAKIKYRPVLFELMPTEFTLSQLQKTAEALSGIPLHKQNFRRLVEQQNLVAASSFVEVVRGDDHRAARGDLLVHEVQDDRPGGQVEPHHGLVEEEDLGVLGDALSDEDSLALSAGQVVELPVGEIVDGEAAQCGVDGLAIGGSESAEESQGGVAGQRHGVAHGDGQAAVHVG